MSNPALSAAEESFRAWLAALPWFERPPAVMDHRRKCLAETCERFEPAFPAVQVHAPCTGDRALFAAGLWWTSAIRGRTQDLAAAARDVCALAGTVGLTVRVTTVRARTSRELIARRIVRIPADPTTATARGNVVTALQRPAEAIGYVLTEGRVLSGIAASSAGVLALVVLDTVGVELLWDALVWDAIAAPRVTLEEVRAARTNIQRAVAVLDRIVVARAGK